MRRAQADQPAEARRRADRAAGVGAGGDVGQPAGDRGGRPEDEPPVTRSGARRIDRVRKMHVLAHQREGKFVGLRLADESRAGVEQHLHRGAVCAGRRGFARPFAGCRSRSRSRRRRICPSRQPQPRQRPGLRIGNRHFRQIEEGVERVARAQSSFTIPDTMPRALFDDQKFFKPALRFLLIVTAVDSYIALAQSRTCLWVSADPSNGEEIGKVTGANPSSRFSGQPPDPRTP